jgi:hypothetical protein
MASKNDRVGPGSVAGTSSAIRPSVMAVAGLGFAAALALIAGSLVGREPESAVHVEATPAAPIAPAAAPESSSPREEVASPRPEPQRGAAKRAFRARPPASASAPVAVRAPATGEPQWDGTGSPSRGWVEHWISQWFAQHRPEVELSPRDLMLAADYAMELDEANRELATLVGENEDPGRAAELQDRAQRANESLLAITGMGGAEIPRVQ